MSQPPSNRLPLVDGIRGYLIFAMTVGHVMAMTGQYGLNFLTHKPFAVFLTGEGFMAVSGFMCGYVLTLGLPRRGASGAMIWGLRRAGKIVAHYLCVFALCALPALIWPLQGSFASLLFHGRSGFGLGDLGLLISGLFRPGFFDILYLYVIYIALAPLAVLICLSRWRVALFLLCLLGWIFTQYGLTLRAFEKAFVLMPFAQISEAGSFHVFAWQLLFFGGVALGTGFACNRERVTVWLQGAGALVLPCTVIAGAFAVAGLLNAAQLIPLGERYLSDYLIVAPMPLVNFLVVAALITLLLSSKRWQDTPPARALRALFCTAPLRDIGKVTLKSFCASIVLSYWVAYWVPAGAQQSLGFALGALAFCLIGVWLTARLMLLRQAR